MRALLAGVVTNTAATLSHECRFGRPSLDAVIEATAIGVLGGLLIGCGVIVLESFARFVIEQQATEETDAEEATAEVDDAADSGH